MSLDLNYHKYEPEFRLLQMEFKQVTNFCRQGSNTA